MLSNATKIVVWVRDDETETSSYGVIHVYGYDEADLGEMVSRCAKRCDKVEVGVSDDHILAIKSGDIRG